MNLGDKCCRWPDGSERIVQLAGFKDGVEYILWNESHRPIGNLGTVVGLTDTVPLNWLRDVEEQEKTTIYGNYHKRG